MLRDKRLVITGVADADSLAYAIAERALMAGAFVTLVAPPEDFPRCRALADGLPFGAHAVRADLTDAADVARLREHLSCGYRAVDGALHAGGVAPPQALADAVAPLLPPGGRSLVAQAGDDGTCFALGTDAGEVLQLAAGAPARRLAAV
jgi:enoyl-[acyl-carrier-protein] reductase (NADH)